MGIKADEEGAALETPRNTQKHTRARRSLDSPSRPSGGAHPETAWFAPLVSRSRRQHAPAVQPQSAVFFIF